jgi:hypothetical protein
MRLSKNFDHSEFFTEDNKPDFYDLSLFVRVGLKLLSEKLEFVREQANLKFPNRAKGIKVSSGVRTFEGAQKLRLKGYNPSVTSDHFLGEKVFLSGPERAKKGDKYGHVFDVATGAVDCYVIGLNNRQMADLYEYLVLNERQFFIKNVGQFIFEKGKSSCWFHISNKIEDVFGPSLARLIDRDLFLTSLDNGASYKQFTKWSENELDSL